MRRLSQSMRHTRGYTLIEVLVYAVILVIVAVTVVQIFLTLGDVLSRNKVDRVLTETVTVAMERMLYEMRSAKNVDTGLSDLGTSPGTLVLDNGTSTVSFWLQGGAIHFSENGVEKGAYTSDAITISSLIFRRYLGPETELVRVALTATAVGDGASTTRTYYGSAVLRESYE